jgi:hypothetical protein
MDAMYLKFISLLVIFSLFFGSCAKNEFFQSEKVLPNDSTVIRKGRIIEYSDRYVSIVNVDNQCTFDVAVPNIWDRISVLDSVPAHEMDHVIYKQKIAGGTSFQFTSVYLKADYPNLYKIESILMWVGIVPVADIPNYDPNAPNPYTTVIVDTLVSHL